MAGGGTIEVELRLKLAQLRKDAQKAGQEISTGLTSDPNKVWGKDPGDENKSRRDRIARRNRNAAMDLADQKRDMALAAAAARAQAIKQQEELDAAVTASARRNRARALGRDRVEGRRDAAQRDRSAFNKDIAFAGLAASNPTSPLAIFAALRQTYSAFTQTKTGTGVLNKVGLGEGGALGGGGAMVAAAGVTAAAVALGLALKGLSVVVRDTMAAYDRARAQYARTLNSGQTQGFAVRQNLLARVIGVSENEVWQYGNAIGYVNGRLSSAVKILTDTQRVLTATSWSMEILRVDLEAMWAQLAYDAAPAVNDFVSALDLLVKGIISHSEEIRAAARGALDAAFPVTAAILAIIQKIGASANAGKDNAPAPTGGMKQLPASAWERMGLVIGGGGGVNYGKLTSDNTGKALVLQQKVIDILNDTFFNKGLPNFPSLP